MGTQPTEVPGEPLPVALGWVGRLPHDPSLRRPSLGVAAPLRRRVDPAPSPSHGAARGSVLQGKQSSHSPAPSPPKALTTTPAPTHSAAPTGLRLLPSERGLRPQSSLPPWPVTAPGLGFNVTSSGEPSRMPPSQQPAQPPPQQPTSSHARPAPPPLTRSPSAPPLE